MSQNMVSPVSSVGFIDTDRSTGPTASLGLVGLAHALLSIEEMDRILLAAPFSYSQSYVDSLTLQDKQYTIKTALEQGTIDTTDLLPVAITNAADPAAEVHPYGTIWRNTTTGDIFQTSGDGTWLKQVDL